MTHDQAHRIPPVPSNVRWPGDDGVRIKEYPDGSTVIYKVDPGYDQPGPPRRSDISWQRFIEGFIVFAAIVLFVFLASLVGVGS